jgi:hypothetical protein
MLFNILKLIGLDVPAKVAAAKSMIEQRVEEVTDHAKQVTQTAVVIAALSAVAGVLVAMAVGVGLFALYRAVAESYGVNAGLGVVAGILIVAALILLLIARTKGQSLSNRHIFEPLRPLATAAPSAAAPAVAAPSPAHAPSPASFAGVPAVSAGDLIERSNIRPWDVQCWMNSSATCATRHGEPPMKPSSGRPIFCATGTGASFSCCLAVRRSPDGCLRDKVRTNDYMTPRPSVKIPCSDWLLSLAIPIPTAVRDTPNGRKSITRSS